MPSEAEELMHGETEASEVEDPHWTLGAGLALLAFIIKRALVIKFPWLRSIPDKMVLYPIIYALAFCSVFSFPVIKRVYQAIRRV